MSAVETLDDVALLGDYRGRDLEPATRDALDGHGELNYWRNPETGEERWYLAVGEVLEAIDPAHVRPRRWEPSVFVDVEGVMRFKSWKAVTVRPPGGSQRYDLNAPRARRLFAHYLGIAVLDRKPRVTPTHEQLASAKAVVEHASVAVEAAYVAGVEGERSLALAVVRRLVEVYHLGSP